MTEKVYGTDKNGNKIWERPAKEYDKGIEGQIIKGLTVGDLLKFAAIVVACVAWYFNQQNQWESQKTYNANLVATIQKVGDTVEKHSKILAHLDAYLSSSTGKQFNDGEPVGGGNYGSGHSAL